MNELVLFAVVMVFAWVVGLHGWLVHVLHAAAKRPPHAPRASPVLLPHFFS